MEGADECAVEGPDAHDGGGHLAAGRAIYQISNCCLTSEPCMQVQHQRGVDAKWRVQTNVLSRGQTLTMEAGTSLQAGQPLTMDFGPGRPDAALLLDYGVLDHTQPAVCLASPQLCGAACLLEPCPGALILRVKHHEAVSQRFRLAYLQSSCCGQSADLVSTLLLQPGFQLTLALPEGDRFYDDKADTVDINGFSESHAFLLKPGEEPSVDMLAFLRLMNLEGVLSDTTSSCLEPGR